MSDTNDTDEVVFPVHLIGLPEEEARISLAHHGPPTKCNKRGCVEEPVMIVMFKRPGAAWGQDIKVAAACETHRPSLEAFIAEVTATDA